MTDLTKTSAMELRRVGQWLANLLGLENMRARNDDWERALVAWNAAALAWESGTTTATEPASRTAPPVPVICEEAVKEHGSAGWHIASTAGSSTMRCGKDGYWPVREKLTLQSHAREWCVECLKPTAPPVVRAGDPQVSDDQWHAHVRGQIPPVNVPLMEAALKDLEDAKHRAAHLMPGERELSEPSPPTAPQAQRVDQRTRERLAQFALLNESMRKLADAYTLLANSWPPSVEKER